MDEKNKDTMSPQESESKGGFLDESLHGRKYGNIPTTDMDTKSQLNDLQANKVKQPDSKSKSNTPYDDKNVNQPDDSEDKGGYNMSLDKNNEFPKVVVAEHKVHCHHLDTVPHNNECRVVVQLVKFTDPITRTVHPFEFPALMEPEVAQDRLEHKMSELMFTKAEPLQEKHNWLNDYKEHVEPTRGNRTYQNRT